MANFWNIWSAISIWAWQSVRRNAGDTAFEAFTPWINWGESITWTSWTWITATVWDNSNSGTKAISVVLPTTWSNGYIWIDLTVWVPSASDNIWISIDNPWITMWQWAIAFYNNINTFTRNTRWIQTWFKTNTDSALDYFWASFYNSQNVWTWENTWILITNVSTDYDINPWYAKWVWLSVYQTWVDWTAVSISWKDDVNTSTNWLMNFSITNTQSWASKIIKINVWTSQQDHNSLYLTWTRHSVYLWDSDQAPWTTTNKLYSISWALMWNWKDLTKQRVVTTTDDATAEINVDTTDVYELSAIANATEFTLTWTPTDWQKLLIRFKDAGVTKWLTWTWFTAIWITLPTDTVAWKRHYVWCVYNLNATQWQVVAYSVQA